MYTLLLSLYHSDTSSDKMKWTALQITVRVDGPCFQSQLASKGNSVWDLTRS